MVLGGIVGLIITSIILIFIYEPIPTSGELLHEYDVMVDGYEQDINIVQTERRNKDNIIQIVLNVSTGAGEYEKPILICSNIIDVELNNVTNTSATISSLTYKEEKVGEFNDREDFCDVEVGDTLEYTFNNYRDEFPVFFH